MTFVHDNGLAGDPVGPGELFGVSQWLHPAEEFEGTEIGLANVRPIIARQGDRARVEGAVDQGATSLFSWPSPRQEG